MVSDLVKFQRLSGLSFKNMALLTEAMTHKSYAAENSLKYDNQRLEFLGDAVLQIVLTKYLYHRYPALQEGALTKLRSALANQTTLALFARELHIGGFLRLGHGEIEQNGKDRDSTLSDAFEALAGAIYLDAGEEQAAKYIMDVLNRIYPDPFILLEDLNPKGALQEYTQAHYGGKAPVYSVLAVNGPAHETEYIVEASLENIFRATGKGTSRKSAEQSAASEAMKLLRQKNMLKKDDPQA